MAKRILVAVIALFMLSISVYIVVHVHVSLLVARIAVAVFCLGVFWGGRDFCYLAWGLTFLFVYLLFDWASHGWQAEMQGISFSPSVFTLFAVMLFAGLCIGYAVRRDRPILRKF